MWAICLFLLHGHFHGGEPPSGELLIASPLPRAIKIRAHIKSLEKKVKVACKKAADLKKKLSKVPEAFREVDREICLRALLQERFKAQSVEKAKFADELKRLSGIAEIATSDAAARVLQMHSQLRSTREKISTSKSLFTFEEARWESATRMVQLQNKLNRAQERVSNLKRSLRDKGTGLVLGMNQDHLLWSHPSAKQATLGGDAS